MLRSIQLNKNELIKENKEFKNIIDKLRIGIEETKKILDIVLNNLEIYYNINKDIINNYNNKKINYYVLTNINKMQDINKYMIKNINDIINEGDVNKKFNSLKEIYDNVNYVYKTEIYKNEDKCIRDSINNKRN